MPGLFYPSPDLLLLASNKWLSEQELCLEHQRSKATCIARGRQLRMLLWRGVAVPRLLTPCSCQQPVLQPHNS
jgi:hypothetical protein